MEIGPSFYTIIYKVCTSTMYLVEVQRIQYTLKSAALLFGVAAFAKEPQCDTQLRSHTTNRGQQPVVISKRHPNVPFVNLLVAYLFLIPTDQ